MLGSLLGGVGSILGGLMGGSESSKGKKKSVTNSRSTTKHTVRLGALVKQAERAGFNPLTVLNAGGLAAFTKTHTSGFSKTKEKFSGSSQSTSPGAAIAGALNAVGGMMQTDGSALSQNSAGAWQAPTGQPAGADELALVNAQLSSAQPILRPPVSSTYSATPVLAKDENAAGKQSDWIKPEIEAATVTNPFPSDTPFVPDPKVPDGGTRYQSEIAETLGDIYRGYRDMKHSWNASRVEPAARNPKVDAAADELIGNPFGGTNLSGNVWDPASISVGLPPVVRSYPKPWLGSGGGW